MESRDGGGLGVVRTGDIDGEGTCQISTWFRGSPVLEIRIVKVLSAHGASGGFVFWVGQVAGQGTEDATRVEEMPTVCAYHRVLDKAALGGQRRRRRIGT